MPQFAGALHAHGGRRRSTSGSGGGAFGSGAVGVWDAVNGGIEGSGSECRAFTWGG